MLKIIEKIFGKNALPTPNVETAPLTADQLESVTKVVKQLKPAQLCVGSAQSVGMQRDHNEDALYSLSAVISDDTTELPFGLFIIADGMGGHQNGEVASGTAIRALSEFVIRKLYSSLAGLRSDPVEESLHEVMAGGIEQAQQAVLRRAPGGGTTLTAALIIGEQILVGHVGDSRGYFIFPDGRIQILTQDHSLVRRLVQLNQITEEEAAVHPQRNVLYRAIGQTEPFKPDINNDLMPHPGYVLLCSDGLWGVVSDTEIAKTVLNAKTLTQGCQSLVDAANAAGGPDNISVILIQYVV